MTNLVPVFDGHNDTILKLEIAARLGSPVDFSKTSLKHDLDLPRARAGGFVGGLMAALAFILHSFAFGLKETQTIVKLNPRYLMPIGLAVSILSAISPIVIGLPVMTGLWFDEPLRLIGMVGSALFFDIGVYLVVVGSTLTIMFSISESI